MGAEKFKSKDIGAGNRAYIVNLWRFLRGDKRNHLLYSRDTSGSLRKINRSNRVLVAFP
jgi:hypothetical protein